ncbi:hypothetical protein EWM64_g4222 [Hericium alpestre]|uniref:Uncharacterized protein n=1 Tax=Hericium alpestre TaxID=135208 RepID=A0A4Z0A1R9_9AGAM|nr:hypothetical protein EWM64_g4222 [Hericium alpestre]
MTIPSSSAVPSGAEAGPSRLTRLASHLSPHAQRVALDFANIRWAQPPERGPSIPQGNADVIQYFPQQITIPQSLISAEGRTWKPELEGAVPDFTGSDKRILSYLGVPSLQIFPPSPTEEREPDAARRIDVRPDPEVDSSVPSSSRNIKEEARDIQFSFDHTDAAYDEEVSADNGRNRTAEAPSRASSGTGDALSRRIETLLAAAEYIERSSGSSEAVHALSRKLFPLNPTSKATMPWRWSHAARMEGTAAVTRLSIIRTLRCTLGST